MLGSDPIYQYEAGLGGSSQHVVSLEPVYKDGGGNRQWVEWFFDNMFNNTCLAFNYVQTGQENSFTWEAMKDGLAIQIPLLDSLSRKGVIRVETLEESGRWFRKNFPVTPATAVTVLTDYQNKNNKSVWFNSRFYRANLFWNRGSFRFRDIHIFDERLRSDYIDKAGASTQCVFETLPVVDGFKWSSKTDTAGLRLTDWQGNQLVIYSPEVQELSGGKELLVKFSAERGMKFELLFNEKSFEMRCTENTYNISWMLLLTTASDAELPFRDIVNSIVTARYKGFDYNFRLENGQPEIKGEAEYSIKPVNDIITADFSIRN
jgi:hypothetical protein